MRRHDENRTTFILGALAAALITALMIIGTVVV